MLNYNCEVLHNSTKPRLSYLDNMRVGAIVMVVITHSMGYCGELNPFHRDVIVFLVHTIAVPVFFVVDGYLAVQLYSNRKQFVYADFVSKSCLRLMVPWIIFTVLYAVARFFFEYVSFLHDRLIVGHSVKQILWAMYGSVYAPQMYFLFSLFLVRLSLPLVLYVIQRGRSILFVSFCLYLFAYKDIVGVLAPFLRIESGQEPIIHAIWGGQFYLFGALLNLYKASLRSLSRWIIPLSLILILLFKTVIPLDQGNIVQYCYLVGFFSAFFVLNQNKIYFPEVGRNTMGIYLVHAPILLKIISLIVIPFSTNGLVSLFLISLLCLIISYQVTRMINRIPYGKIVFGLS